MTTPVKPPVFHPERAPIGVEVKFYSRWHARPMLNGPCRVCVVHTNAASGEGSLASASAWSERNVSDPDTSYTIPHYQVDRDGSARKMLPTNRRGIANSTGDGVQGKWGDSSTFSMAIETADTGTKDDPAISAFTSEQIETLATIIAYESITCGFPIEVPKEWYGAGVAAHTDPFPYPYYTTVRGKTCPGAKKKAQMPVIRWRAQQIKTAWLAPPKPQPKPPTTKPPLEADVNWTPTAQTMDLVNTAPPTAAVRMGTADDWAAAALLEAFCRLTGIPRQGWTDAVGLKVNEVLSASKVTPAKAE